jgi:hypothetical protein
VEVHPWPAGNPGLAVDRLGRRIARAVATIREDPADNQFTRQVEGLLAIVDRDSHVVQEALVLHQVSYADRGRIRLVCHRAGLSEMVVPYGDPGTTHWWMAVFATHALWVPNDPAQRHAVGDYPNQHPGGDGMATWTAANRDLRDRDIVPWHSFGTTRCRAPRTRHPSQETAAKARSSERHRTRDPPRHPGHDPTRTPGDLAKIIHSAADYVCRSTRGLGSTDPEGPITRSSSISAARRMSSLVSGFVHWFHSVSIRSPRALLASWSATAMLRLVPSLPPVGR